MDDAGDDWRQAAGWYPEVVAVGDARGAWQAEFDRRGVLLRARCRESVSPHHAARVENGELHADLLLNPRKRQFYLALRSGRTTDLAAAFTAS